MAAAALPGQTDRREPPAAVQFTVPADLSLLATIRTAVEAIVREIGGSSACVRDLKLATDEAAAVLIEDSTPWTDLKVEIVHDDADVYVRVIARRVQPARLLVVYNLTQLLLDGVIESHEIFGDGDRGYAFLQAPLSATGPSD